jgi:hypothetical protein
MESIGAPAYLLREAHEPAVRDVTIELLAAGGWPRHLLARWASDGVVLELYDPADEIPRGAAIVEFVGDGTYELRAWVATMNLANRGVAGRLVRAVADALRRSGGRRVVASVGDADPHRLTLLLEAGFRISGVERDAPSASGGRTCDPSRDLVWMDQDL